METEVKHLEDNAGVVNTEEDGIPETPNSIQQIPWIQVESKNM